jgi:hypothetical protein
MTTMKIRDLENDWKFGFAVRNVPAEIANRIGTNLVEVHHVHALELQSWGVPVVVTHICIPAGFGVITGSSAVMCNNQTWACQSFPTSGNPQEWSSHLLLTYWVSEEIVCEHPEVTKVRVAQQKDMEAKARVSSGQVWLYGIGYGTSGATVSLHNQESLRYPHEWMFCIDANMGQYGLPSFNLNRGGGVWMNRAEAMFKLTVAWMHRCYTYPVSTGGVVDVQQLLLEVGFALEEAQRLTKVGEIHGINTEIFPQFARGEITKEEFLANFS